MTTIFLVIVVWIATFHLIVPVIASKNRQHDARKKVLEWLSENEDFKFSDKLALRDGRIVAEETIEADEVLMVIPATKILSADDDEEKEERQEEMKGEGTLCLLYEALDWEIGLGEESEFAPHIRQIRQEQAFDISLPSLWSNTAQRLLTLVSLVNPKDDIISLIDRYSFCIDLVKEFSEPLEYHGEEHLTKLENGSKSSNRIKIISPEEKMNRMVLALAIKHQIDQRYLVPLYDQLPHHHLTYNVKYNIRDDDTVEVMALKRIHLGQELSRQTISCLHNCHFRQQAVAVDALSNYGEVQPYPHLWNLSIGMSFIYNGNAPPSTEAITEERPKSIKWIQPPTQEFQLENMEKELKRQRKLYKKEVLLSRDSVDPREWEQIDRYCRSLMGALKDAIKQGYEYLETLELQSDSESGDDDGLKSLDQVDKTATGVDETCSAESSFVDEDNLDTNREKIYEEMYKFKHAMQSNALKPSLNGASDPWLVKGCGSSEKCTMVHIALSRGCESYEFDTRRNETEWAAMRSAYIAIVGPRKASIKLAYGSGFRVPIKIGHSPGRGRGVFTTADIPKGTLVWQSYFTAIFTEGVQFRQFLSVMPDDIVCDLIAWCYTFMDEGDQTLACDLDEASLVNHADHEFEYNIGEIGEENKDQKKNARDIDLVFALRDIEAGEELVTAYDEFHSFGFEDLGLL